MSQKFKNYLELSSRQKKRRLDAIIENRQQLPLHDEDDYSDTNHDDNNDADINYDLDDGVNHPADDNVDNAVDDNVVNAIVDNHDINVNPDPDDDDDGGVSNDSDDNETVSSYEEDNEYDFEPEISIAVANEDDDLSASDDENRDNAVQEDIVGLQRRSLKNAFLAANINHSQGNVLLKTLRQFPFNMYWLPKDSRTVMNTPTIVASTRVQNLAGGQYLHIGFKKTLVKKLENIPVNLLPDTIDIDFSTDGAKVDKGADQFWPHQYRILNIDDDRPIIAGIFQGNHKPSNPFEFYEAFAQELMDVQENGVLVRNKLCFLNVRLFIADAEARAFVLNHYKHNSTNPCSKCKVEGHRSTVPGFERTMVFPGDEHPLRTDEEYQNLIDEDHQKGGSPLAALLPLVKRVPFEVLHSVYLGNTKKILCAQVGGQFGFRRLNVRKLQILDARMSELILFCPSDFNRRPQVLTKYHAFKGTEFRQFLLYTSPAVVKNVFDEDYYTHLMILHSSMRLLNSSNTLRDMYPFCREALKSYFTLCEVLYGEQFLSYNVHSVLHLVDDVEELGPADTHSAFRYENNMQELRKFIRKPGLKLPQIYKRICEKEDYALTPIDRNIRIELSQRHEEGPLPADIDANICEQFRKIAVGKCTLSTALRDNCCILKNSEICIINNIIQTEEHIFLIVQNFRIVNELYNIGISSTSVGVYTCQDLDLRLKAIPITYVERKMYRMPKWSDVEGEEEHAIPNHWICASLLSPFTLPENM
ncbi:uncharacterized protein LOC122506302 isoform X1 [Leptopilina heterotoma]|uniref:uncharacterized protein LOC122506302 isoform X1 n=1 Tax=Leptopilina heterotoma TaxID=63436 RepID=UPI001CA80DCD|nr:uncharacterized protein LOC122506302 isoform X1 [Leptopilina heterotoma]XP_043474345.1 uncharacterized protein LOC122506302 isoform X1 [Leptopilina heterotoma]